MDLRGRDICSCRKDTRRQAMLHRVRLLGYPRSDVRQRREQNLYEDAEIGLYYNRFRYYDPNLGGYISQDPISFFGGNLALYTYINNPNIQFDALGLHTMEGEIYSQKGGDLIFQKEYITKVSHPLKHQLFSFSFVCLPPYPLTVNTCLTEVMQTIHILRPIFPTLQPLQGFCSSLCRFR